MTREAEREGGGRLRRRLIVPTDLPAVTALLASAFPRRDAGAWWAGLDRLGRRRPPDDLPRYGVLLEADGRIVGVLLTICTEAGARSGGSRCHLSSWFVEPAFASQAPLLPGPLLRRPDVTLVNTSPAAHTEPILVAQGFRLLSRGSLLVLPALAAPRTVAREITVAEAAALPEGDLLATHIGWGCRCLGVAVDGRTLPFVFARPKRLRGVLPASRLLYCRDIAGFAAHAGALGRGLLRLGILGVLVDTAAPISGLRGLRVGGTQGRYARGPHPPLAGDLAYSEDAIFPDREVSP